MMKLHYLFPHRFKRIGLFILIPFILFGIYVVDNDIEPDFLDCKVHANLVDENIGES